MLIGLLFTNPVLFLMVSAAILLALSIHEYFHAWTAFVLGDSTAKEQGRLTINPISHLDPIGTVLLFLVGIGWGKPVPFNPYNLRNQKWGEFLVGLAGPGSNFLVAILAGLFLRFFFFATPALLFFFSFFVWINIVLGMFNLLPIHPLDGSHIFFKLPGFQKLENFFIANNFLFIILLLLFMQFFGLSFLIKPIFTLITGMPMPISF